MNRKVYVVECKFERGKNWHVIASELTKSAAVDRKAEWERRNNGIKTWRIVIYKPSTP